MERPIRYLRASFLYGRTFVSDADLNDQAAHWLADVADVRQHATTHWVPLERFLTVEQPILQAPPARPYQSLILPPARPASETPPPLPHVAVERRESSTYAALAAGGDV